MKSQTNLVGVQPLVDIISLSLQSTFVKNEKNGVSLILISRPETAKTSTIFYFSNLDFVSYYDEVTQKKLMDEFLPLAKQRQKRTLLIPDLINCIEKQKSTRNQFLNILKSGTDDNGIIRISTFHKQLAFLKLFEGIRFNVITAITTPNFLQIKRSIVNTGLLSRFLPFSYDYPIDKLRLIFNAIETGTANGDITIPKITKKDVAIKSDAELFKQFEMLSTELGRHYNGFGIRAQTNLQRLAKANALLNHRNSINQDDITKVLHLGKWINYSFNPL